MSGIREIEVDPHDPGSWNEALLLGCRALEKDELVIVVQVNGKLRSRFQVATDSDDETIREIALKDERIQKFIHGKEIKKLIVVKNKLVNIVV